ncbi:MAG: hypothetical protein WA913_06515 [Pricia sp.]
MKKKYLLLILGMIFINCNDDDLCAIPEGTIVDPINQQLSIELINNNGENLIDNGTYAESDIIVIHRGFEITNSVNRNFESERKVIKIGISGTERGENVWLIQLNSAATDTLLLDIEQEMGDCGSISYIPRTAFYNGERKLLDTISDSKYYPRITVLKEQ